VGGAWRLLSRGEDSRPPLSEVATQSNDRHHRDNKDTVDLKDTRLIPNGNFIDIVRARHIYLKLEVKSAAELW
jgi:hypothetical protein